MVTALIIRPGEHPWPTLLCDDREYLNRAVSSKTSLPFTAMVKRVEEGIVVLYGDEAAVLDGVGNRCINGCIFAGTSFIVGCQDGELRSLSDEDIARYTVQLWEPEQYTDDEIMDSYFYCL